MTSKEFTTAAVTSASAACACLVAISIGISMTPCEAHNGPVHIKISTNAALSSLGLKAFLTNYLEMRYNDNLSRPQLHGNSPMGWIATGSREEDAGPSRRSCNHFYTVTPARQLDPGAPGLSDFSETLGVGWWGTVNAFKWTTDPAAREPLYGALNSYSWANARTEQYEAFTMATQSGRENKLADMLCALGHIMHLNQDMSHPDHVRNDEHPFIRYLEDFG
jgi:hypothetical protein